MAGATPAGGPRACSGRCGRGRRTACPRRGRERGPHSCRRAFSAEIFGTERWVSASAARELWISPQEQALCCKGAGYGSESHHLDADLVGTGLREEKAARQDNISTVPPTHRAVAAAAGATNRTLPHLLAPRVHDVVVVRGGADNHLCRGGGKRQRGTRARGTVGQTASAEHDRRRGASSHATVSDQLKR